MNDQPPVVTRQDLEQRAQQIVDTLGKTGEAMTSPLFLKSLGTAAMVGAVFWLGRRRGRKEMRGHKKLKKAISELARMV